MRNLVLGISIVILGLFSSCDKCKDADCKNGSSCSKGDCECTTFFSGEKCDTEVRAIYNAKYAGTFTYSDGSKDRDTFELRSSGTNASKLEVVDGEGLVFTLTSPTNFSIFGEEIDGNDRWTVTGSGNFTSTAMSFDVNTKYTEDGKIIYNEDGKFDGTKI